jgi:hypothetical protein
MELPPGAYPARAPALDPYLRGAVGCNSHLPTRQNLVIQELISELRGEALAVAVLPLMVTTFSNCPTFLKRLNLESKRKNYSQ